MLANSHRNPSFQCSWSGLAHCGQMVCHFLPMWEIGGPIFRLICLGKRQTEEQMKWDNEDEGICWLNICVNGTLDFSFPISAVMICLRLLPWRSALLPYLSLITWKQHAPQVHLMALLFPRFLLKFIILIVYPHLWQC